MWNEWQIYDQLCRTIMLCNVLYKILCNVLYKILAKVLATCLKSILPVIVTENQSVFVPGRNITDNVLIAFEVIHYMKQKIMEDKER